MKKRIFYSEAAYAIGLLLIAASVVLLTKADFGVSMIVAPAYVIYRAVSQTLDFFTFGMAEYCFQGLLLIIMAIAVRRFRVSYLLSFATAVLYGIELDILTVLGNFLPTDLVFRLIYYPVGVFICAIGVSMMFHAYISPEVYELFVKEVSSHFKININKVKTVFDCSGCVLGLLLSFLFFGWGKFVGVNIGTVICAIVNGFLIGRCSVFMEKKFVFVDAFKWRTFFTGEEPVTVIGTAEAVEVAGTAGNTEKTEIKGE